MLNILVCVKQVPDTTNIKIDPVTNTLIRTGVPSIVNPFDAYALELAVGLKEKHGGSVTVISMGPPQAKVALKECLSKGADKAYLMTDRAVGGSDTLATSYILSCVAKKLGPFDVIFCGKQAIDGHLVVSRWNLDQPLSLGMGDFALYYHYRHTVRKAAL